MVADGAMLEHAHVFGHFYGSPMVPVAEAVDAGRDVLFDIDWQGAQQIRNSALGRNTLSIFILPPSIPELKRRLISRGQDGPDVIAKRMLKSWDEISHWDGYDYVLINDDLDTTFARLTTIVSAERLRRAQQPGLAAHVRRLHDEFEEDQE
jgi:guanylate kinase